MGRNHFLMLLLSFPAVSSKETQLCPGARLHCRVPTQRPRVERAHPGSGKGPRPPRGQGMEKKHARVCRQHRHIQAPTSSHVLKQP